MAAGSEERDFAKVLVGMTSAGGDLTPCSGCRCSRLVDLLDGFHVLQAADANSEGHRLVQLAVQVTTDSLT